MIPQNNFTSTYLCTKMESLRSNACRSMLLEDGCTIFVSKPLNVNPCSIELNGNLWPNCLAFGLCDDNLWSGHFLLICWPSSQFFNPLSRIFCCQVLAWTILKHFGPLASFHLVVRVMLDIFNWNKHCTNFCATNHAILQPLLMPTSYRGAWGCLQVP